MVWDKNDDEGHRLVDTYAEWMKNELSENWIKGDREVWTNYSMDECFSEIRYHLDKLENAVAMNSDGSNNDQVKEYAADVGNCAMIFLDVLGLIEPAPPAKPIPNQVYNSGYDYDSYMSS
jgi:hypothetical protein